MISSGPAQKSFWDELVNYAKEAYQALFGSSETVTVAVATPASQPKSSKIKLATPLSSKRKSPDVKVTPVIPVQVQGSKIKLATPLSSKRKHPAVNVEPNIEIDLVADDTPEEIERDKRAKAQNNTLTFQYLNTLKVNPNETLLVRVQALGGNYFKLASEAYAKYHQADKAATLQKLMSLMSEIGEESSKSLLNGGWLSSKEVNYYFEILVKNHPDVYHIDSGAGESIQNLIKGLANPRSKRAEQMRAANRIFWPICQNSHWFLMIMDKNDDQSYNVSCLNSLGWDQQQITAKAESLLKALYPQADQDKLVKEPTSIKVPQQHNGDDCGVAACYWGAQIINGTELPKKMSGTWDYSQYRFDIAETFAKQVAKEKAAEKPKPDVIVIDDEEEVQSSRAIVQLRNKKFRK